jgi:four helix bundle protein
MKRLFEKLAAWRESYSLCLVIYKLVSTFPSEEKFGLISQMQRASASVPINIAEGNCKESLKDRRRFFEISLASLNELYCECLLAKDLGYIPQESFLKAEDHIQRASYLLTKLIRSISSPKPHSSLSSHSSRSSIS